MKFSNEQIEELKSCSNAEEAVAKAAQAGFELSTEQAEQFLSAHEFEELGDNELNTISGGCSSSGSDPSWTCALCHSTSTGSPTHKYTNLLPSNAIQSLPACESCYQAHKDALPWQY